VPIENGTLAQSHRFRSGWYRPSLELLEDRTLLNGNAVAFFVAGYGGQTIPMDTVQHVDSLFRTAYSNKSINNYDIYITNWNSPDPTSFVYDSSHQNNGGSISGNPGSTVDNLIQAAGTVILGTPIFNTLIASQDPNAPNPSLPNDFINSMTNILNTQYDDNDFIALVGHSFGGNSVLQVANHTNRKIDFLATLDPVGWSTTGVASTENVALIPPLSVNVPTLLQPIFGNSVPIPGTPVDFPAPVGALASIFSANMIDANPSDYQQGSPGYRNALPSPQSNVEYFYNRWQENFPFPFDYQPTQTTSGFLNDTQVQHNVDAISYNGSAIQAQEAANDFRNAQGNPVFYHVDPFVKNPTLDTFLNIMWGYSQANVTLPSIDINGLHGGSITFSDSSRMTHQELPSDTYIQDQINAIFDALFPTANAVAPQIVHEGDTVTLTGSAASNGSNAPIQYSWKELAGPADVTPFSPMYNPNVANPTFVVPETGIYTFQLTVTNTVTGRSGTAKTTFDALNVPPTAGPISGPSQVIRNFPSSYSITFTDPGLIDSHSVFWDFGDGNVTTQPSESPATIEHTYTTEGNDTIRAIVSDQDGGQSAVVSYAVTVKAAGLVTNPTTGKQDLIVSGTPGNDTTVLTAGPTPGSVQVTENGVSEGTFTPTGMIKVVGFGGSDTLIIDFSNGNLIPPGGLIFDPGSDPTANNKLVLLGGSFINEVYTPSGPGAGTLTLDGSTLSFSNLHSIDDTVSVTTDTINGTAASEPINVVDHSGLVNGFQATQVNSGNIPTFVPVNFANKSNVIVNGVGGSDTFTINNPNSAAGLASLTVNGSNAANTFNVQAMAAATTINTKGGQNTIDVGSNAPAIGGILSGIQGALTINGSHGTDIVNVDDTGAAGNRSGKISPTTLTGLGMGPSGITFSGLSKLNLNMGPGALFSDTFDITDVAVPSLVTAPRYLLADQKSAGQLTVVYNDGSVHVDNGIPGSFAGPTATVTLFEGYSPWLLHEVFPDPPGANNNGSTGGTPTPPPSVPSTGNSSDPQHSGADSNAGSLPAGPPVATSPTGTGTPGEANPGSTGQQGNTIAGSSNAVAEPDDVASLVVGIDPLTAGSLPPSGGSPVPISLAATAPNPAFSPFMAFFEMELKWLETEWAELESIWFQALSNFRESPLH
jgi:hypothetical protein